MSQDIINIVLLSLAAAATVFVLSRLVRRMFFRARRSHHNTRIHRGYCPGCGYDFAGRFNRECPECGRALTERERQVLGNITPALRKSRLDD